MISIQAPEDTEREVEQVDLGGTVYDFAFPKTNLLIQSYRKAGLLPKDEQGLASVDAQYRWLEKGFGEEQWGVLQARLDDEDDWLDHPHMDDLFKQLVRLNTGRPTMSRPSSSQQPRQKKQTAKRSQKASA
jgi:hypothetical protein